VNDQAIQAEALRQLDAGGIAAVDAHMRVLGPPSLVTATYAALARELYGKRKDVAGMIACARSGIAYALEAASRSANTEDALALKNAAKTLAYNTGANCWPGWNDEGVVITREHVEAGLSFAETSHCLVQELGLGPKPLATSHWLIGALHLAARRSEQALTAFRSAEAESHAAGNPISALLAKGYGALAETPKWNRAGTAFTDVLEQLELDGSKEATGFRNQLLVAERTLATWQGV
jgi:hypothetical protein